MAVLSLETVKEKTAHYRPSTPVELLLQQMAGQRMEVRLHHDQNIWTSHKTPSLDAIRLVFGFTQGQNPVRATIDPVGHFSRPDTSTLLGVSANHCSPTHLLNPSARD
jgi:hypothetical protein